MFVLEVPLSFVHVSEQKATLYTYWGWGSLIPISFLTIAVATCALNAAPVVPPPVLRNALNAVPG